MSTTRDYCQDRFTKSNQLLCGSRNDCGESTGDRIEELLKLLLLYKYAAAPSTLYDMFFAMMQSKSE